MKKISAALLLFVLAASAGVWARSSKPAFSPEAAYTDFRAMLESTTAAMRNALREHPELEADSVRHHILDEYTDGPVGPASMLTPPRKKKLSSEEVYARARRSSLIYCNFIHNSELVADTAYKTASAVVLTEDGICATNYHVVADMLLTGILGRDFPNDRGRFLLDCDGNVFPLKSVLAADPVNDWAIIRIEPRGHKLTPIPFGGEINGGARVYCLASPSQGYFNFTDGVVSNKTRTTDKKNGFTQYNLEITAEYGAGASGGPILDECGNLVGLVSSTVALYADPQNMRNFQMTYKQTVPVFLLRERFTD